MKPRLFLLDANALLHRAWHAFPPLTAPSGKIVNALYGVLLMTLRTFEQETPDACVACWDLDGPTFRHEAFGAYKAQRERKDEALYEQIPLVQEGLRMLGIPSLSSEGFEADDVIGTLAKQACVEGWDVSIFTGDRDLLQLIEPGIVVRLFRKGMLDTAEITTENMQQLFDLTPQQMIDYKMLRGDVSDNIPGIKGIGEKGAKELLARYGSVDQVYVAARQTDSTMTPRQRKALLEGEGELEGLRSLITLRTDVPLSWQVQKTAIDPQNEMFQQFLRTYGFRSLMKIEKKGEKNAPIPLQGMEETEKRTNVVFTNLSSMEEARSWFGAHTGVLGFEIVSGGAMMSPELWIGTENGDVALLAGAVWKQQQELETLLHEREAESVWYDAKRAFHVLADAGIALTTCKQDVLLAAYLLEANVPEPSFETILAAYLPTKTPLRVEERVIALARLAPLLEVRLEERGLLHLLKTMEIPLISVLVSMERAGILIDQDALAKLKHTFSASLRSLQEQMEQLVGHTFNPASPLQLANILFQELHLPVAGIKKGKKGYSTASSELDKLRGQHPMIEFIEQHREAAKLLSTYVLPLPSLADHQSRVHTTFHQALASTGRLSSTDPNLQNIPIRTEFGRQMREVFIAPPGKLLLSCDYSQIELRIAAALAKDQALLQVFKEGKDVHKATAAAMWRIPFEEVTTDQRRAAKAVNFGVLFGQGAFGLSAGAGVSFQEAKDFIDRYFSVYSRLHDYLEEVKTQARTNGYVETWFGRRRPIPEIHARMPAVRAQAERMAINMPIQGTEADILKLAMISLRKELPRWSKTAKLLLQVHDELVFEVAEDEVQVLAQHIVPMMRDVADIGVILEVEAKAGPTWGQLHAL